MNYRNFNFWDIALIKLSVLAATLFLVSVWPGLASWAIETHWAWFLVVAIVLGIKPSISTFKK